MEHRLEIEEELVDAFRGCRLGHSVILCSGASGEGTGVLAGVEEGLFAGGAITVSVTSLTIVSLF